MVTADERKCLCQGRILQWKCCAIKTLHTNYNVFKLIAKKGTTSAINWNIKCSLSAQRSKKSEDARCPSRTVGFTPPPGAEKQIVHIGMHYLRGFCNLKWFNYLLSSPSESLDAIHYALCTHSAEYLALSWNFNHSSHKWRRFFTFFIFQFLSSSRRTLEC